MNIKEPQLFVYPNPSSDKELTVKFSEEEVVLISFFDINGKLLFEKEVQGMTILDMSVYSDGTYLLTIRNKERLITRKVMIN